MKSHVTTLPLEMLKASRAGWVRRTDLMDATGAWIGAVSRIGKHLVDMGFLDERRLPSKKNREVIEYRLSKAWGGPES